MRLALIALALALASAAAADPPAPRDRVVRVEHRPADRNPTIGPHDAPVTAELFLVPGHVESNRAYKKLVELQARHPRRLRVVFRVITRQTQIVVSVAAIEAYAQGKFHELMEALLASRSGTVRKEHLPAVAEAAGIDPIRLERALERALDPDLLPEALQENDRRRLRLLGATAHIPDLTFNAEPVGQPLASLDVDELDRHYARAYDEAIELRDEGVPARHVLAAAERRRAPRWAPTTYPAGAVDDPEAELSLPDAPPLLARALDLAGLPSRGPDDAAVVVVIACNLRYVSCRQQLENVARRLHDLYPDEVRVVWHPWFDVGVEGNEAAPRLHAAALCAEAQGAGWRWLEEAAQQVMRGAADGDPDELIETIAARVDVDDAALAACVADGEDGVRARVRAAIAAGVHHAPTVVIGGRVYTGGFTDWRGAAERVDGELAPGLLERLVPDWEPTTRSGVRSL